jgi:hypothetical protein
VFVLLPNVALHGMVRAWRCEHGGTTCLWLEVEKTSLLHISQMMKMK